MRYIRLNGCQMKRDKSYLINRIENANHVNLKQIIVKFLMWVR